MTVDTAAAIAFLENAFRNIDLPPLSADDIEDIRVGLSDVVANRAAAPQSAS